MRWRRRGCDAGRWCPRVGPAPTRSRWRSSSRRCVGARGDRDGAHALLSAICEVAPGHTEAATALAKDCEHRLRRPDLALQWALAAAWPCAQRVARLRRKLAVGSGVAIECPAIECPATATAVVPPVAATDLHEMPPGPTLPGARTTAPVVPAAAVTRAEAGAAAIPGSWRRRSATVVG
ncbi:MAG: hypothetical protein IPN32_30100 [Deltaproteobacteria bacterium]|nr:hypothetical protein [Deltaproteobacteria bacterium]